MKQERCKLSLNSGTWSWNFQAMGVNARRKQTPPHPPLPPDLSSSMPAHFLEYRVRDAINMAFM
uniref:Uncharacterized protein n=1 Tax=Oryza sativa subsp. japonica TaxID=39947 RepID=Q60E44_ORYSJ|nr:hypothetical protein [Oryza sativa Japonica Group]AAV59359.1 hypothetical protein [Oryza sativa Japonica Group]